MNYLVYQAYNNEDILNECLYSLYTYCQFIDDNNIVIYTDRADYLKKLAPSELNITYREITEKEIVAWKGPRNFVHRFKIEMLRDFMDSLDGEHNILYIDTDTTIINPLKNIYAEIGQGNLFMHKDEGLIRAAKKNRIFNKVEKYMNSNREYSGLIPANQNMWNAGALGFKLSDKHLLAKALEYTDKIYSEFPIHVAEQLAFSIIFSSQNNRPLSNLENEIFHYWNFKEFRVVLSRFFEINKNDQDIKNKLYQINPQELIQDKLNYEKMNFFNKFFYKILGKNKLKGYAK